MKQQLITPLLNWRLSVIAVLAFITLILACDEAEHTLTAYLAIKGAALAIGIIAVALAKKWHAQGFFDEIENTCNEE